jgi:acetylglutamate kinase
MALKSNLSALLNIKMKLVLKVAGIAGHNSEYGHRFARAVADLLRDGHLLTVVHGQGHRVQPCQSNANGNGSGNCRDSDVAECAAFTAIERENRVLVSLLGEATVLGIGLRATDAGLVQLRKQYPGNGATGTRVEAARLHSRWLDIICGNKGVPVLSNLCCWVGGEDHLIDPDQMAAVCAADWNADALIYITEENGVPGVDGGILRWFDINASDDSQAALLSDEMRAHLDACAIALRHGVRRVRILPLSNVDCLSSFYFSSIKYGTEVIAATARVEKSVAASVTRH